METKALAYGIAGFLLGGLVVSFAATQLDPPASQRPEMSMTDMTNDLTNKSGDEFDTAFIAHMIEHHESAVDMAKLAEKNAKHEEIKQLSRDIMVAQESEIAKMKQWQNDWGYEDKYHGSTSH